MTTTNLIVNNDFIRVDCFYDKQTGTFSYILTDKETSNCAVIDPILDYSPDSGRISTEPSDEIIEYIKQRYLNLEWILETHIHADHLTGASYIKEKLGGRIAISDNITEVLSLWVPIFNTEKDTPLDGSQFDYLLADGEKFFIGNLEIKTIHTPGHTPACASFVTKDYAFVGDTIFSPQLGTARTDFPGGSAQILYQSIQKLFTLPDQTRLFFGHDYPEIGKQPQFSSTVIEQKNTNILVNSSITEEQYIEVRNKKDIDKPVPKLLLPSVQINLRAGKLGNAEENGIEYVKIPFNKFGRL